MEVIDVYVLALVAEKLKLWNWLSSLIRENPEQNIIIGGDFNAIKNSKEKRGGIIPSMKVMEDFDNFITENDLFEVATSNGMFSWNNRRVGFLQIKERLDRFLLVEAWKLTTLKFTS